MIELSVKISNHAKDIIQKYTSALFKDATLEFYGIKTAKIKELINVELPIVEVADSYMDSVFLLEDNSYQHYEFQSTYSESDLMRFARYDTRLYERDRRIVNTVVIYTSDVKEAPASIVIGSLTYAPDKIMMGSYDGNIIYKELDNKIKLGNVLTDVDMLNLIFLPLMRNTIPKEDLAVKSIELAQTRPDQTKRNTCIAAAFAFANKYLSESNINKLLEVLKMTDLATLLIEDAVKDTVRNTSTEIAKNALKEGSSIEFVERITGLGTDTIKRLQEELSNAY